MLQNSEIQPAWWFLAHWAEWHRQWSCSHCSESLEVEYGLCSDSCDLYLVLLPIWGRISVCVLMAVWMLKRNWGTMKSYSTVLWPRSIVAEVFVCVRWQMCIWYMCAYMCVQRVRTGDAGGCVHLSISQQKGLFTSPHDWVCVRTLAGLGVSWN